MLKRLVFALAVLALVPGCGFYTNLPAQIFVAEVKPGSLTFEPPNTAGVREIKIEEPEVTLRGEAGSIGAIFNQMQVNYFLINGKPVNAEEIPPMTLGMSFRVETSNHASDLAAGPVVQDQLGVAIYAGRTKFSLPIITRHVEQFGLKANPPDGNASAVYAKVSLGGFDDANYPIAIDVFCPITFHGAPGTGK